MEILFFLNKEDLRRLKYTFDIAASPGFTILEETQIDTETDLIWVKVFFEDSIQVWYTIGSVFQLAGHETRMKEIMDQLNTKLKK